MVDYRYERDASGRRYYEPVINRESPYNYDFDSRARAMNAYHHPPQPDTPYKSGRGSDNTTGNRSFETRSAILPLNAAIRDLDDMVTNFDISRLPDYDNMPTTFCGHLLFSRPSLYIDCDHVPPTVNGARQGYSTSNLKLWETDPRFNYTAMMGEPLTASFVSDPAGRLLLRQLSQFCSNPYIPLFTTKALTYSTADISIKTVDKGATFYGHTIKYGHYSEEHKIGGTISLEFLNDRYWSVLKTCYMWMAYIYMVSKTNAIRPSLPCQTGGIIDYAGSIYYLVTDMDNHRLVYWEKLTGVFPKMVPFSLFSTEDNPKVEDKVSIEFDYGIKSDPCDPSILLDINTLTFGTYEKAIRYLDPNQGGHNSYAAVKANGKPNPNNVRQDEFRGGIMARSNVEAARPVIYGIDNSDGRSYYLDWLLTSKADASYGSNYYLYKEQKKRRNAR